MARLFTPQLGALERSGSAVQQLGDLPGIGVRVVQREREQRTGELLFARIGTPGKTPQRLRVLVVERDAQLMFTAHLRPA